MHTISPEQNLDVYKGFAHGGRQSHRLRCITKEKPPKVSDIDSEVTQMPFQIGMPDGCESGILRHVP